MFTLLCRWFLCGQLLRNQFQLCFQTRRPWFCIFILCVIQLPRATFIMFITRTRRCECFGTNLTRKRFLAGMNPHMVLQRRTLREFLPACFTRVRRAVVLTRMHDQMVLQEERFPTHVARPFRFRFRLARSLLTHL